MKADPCSVCGGTDVNLVDGYYYCIECGTQDENVRETVVEHTMADGTFALTLTRKIAKTNIQMSKEWYKWHAYNFILSGMADELVALGASPTFKMKVLWIWTRYVKKYQESEEDQEGDNLFGHKENNDNMEDLFADSDISDKEEVNQRTNEKRTPKISRIFDIKLVTLSVLHAMLYAALNLDNSEIQLSHIQRFIREGRLSSIACLNYVPKDLHVENIPNWNKFCKSRYHPVTPYRFRHITMTLFNKLALGSPNIPDMKKIIYRFVKELCLPDDFRCLVYALMLKIPWKPALLKLNNNSLRIPDFEGVAMAYVVMGLKICFGLDDGYEIRMSDALEKVNKENNFAKSYKFDMFSDDTGRLFSFREWANFLKFRKVVLSHFYYPAAIQNNIELDDYAFITQTKDRYKMPTTRTISDDVTMSMVRKILSNNIEWDNCKIDFPPSLTPLSTYTDIIASHVLDPDLRLLLYEDFTKYSLKYSTVDFKLQVNDENIIVGVNEINKIQSDIIVGNLIKNLEYDQNMVYVRNCDNKNWMVTKPPTLEHVNNETENRENSDSEPNCETVPHTADIKTEEIPDESITDLIEDDEELNIFNDVFEEIKHPNEFQEEPNNINNEDDYSQSMAVEDDKNSVTISNSDEYSSFDPNTFDRDEAIKQLVKIACRKYKIPLPRQYKEPNERKRKQREQTGTEAIETKRAKAAQRSEGKIEINRLIETYHRKILNDIIESVNSKILNDSTNTQHSNLNEMNPNVSGAEICSESLPEYVANQDDHGLMENNSKNDEDEQMEDSKFDENIYDVNQLYVKFKEMDFEQMDLQLDSDLDEILSKTNTTLVNKNKKKMADNKQKEIKSSYKIGLKENCDKFMEPLICRENIKDYGYWIRIYYRLTKNFYSYRLFDADVLENFPKSFNFVFNICASICEGTMMEIYHYLGQLEQSLLVKN